MVVQLVELCSLMRGKLPLFFNIKFRRKEKDTMALSGTITGSTNNSRYSLTCEWSASQNTSANTSTITAIVYLTPPSGWNTISNYWSCVINGTTVTSNMSANISSKTELGRRTWTVNHNNDGTCSTSISFSFSNRVTAGTYTVSSGSGSGNITLNSIARTSSFTLSKSSCTIGSENFVVNINSSANNFTHTVYYRLGSINWKALDKSGDRALTIAPAMGDCNQIPNSTSGIATIVVETYNGNTYIGSTSKTITLNVPSSVVPSVGISLTANNQLNGVNVAGKTTFTVKPTNASGSYGSTIRSYSTVGQGLNTSSSNGGTSSTMNSGTYTYTVTVTDSRGRTAKASKQVTVVNHESPTLSLVAYRSDSSGNKAPEGTYIHGDMTWSVFNPNNNNQNAKQYRVLKKTQNSATWSVVKDWTNLSAYSGTAKISFGNGFAVATSYDVGVEVKDSYSNVGVTQSVGTVSCLFNIEKSGVSVGKRWERGALDVGGDIYASGSLRINANSKEARVGSGHSDVYLHNSKSNKYLQLKDDGTLSYSDNKIYHAGNKPKPSDIGALGAKSANGYYGMTLPDGTDANWIRTTSNGIIPYASGTNSSLGTSSWKFAKAYIDQVYADGIKCNGIERPSGDLWINSNTGIIFQYLGSGNGYLKPYRAAMEDLGASGNRWRNVWASNGTIQTSDMRYKSDIQDVDDSVFYNMIKNTPVHTYVLNDTRVDLKCLDVKPLTRETAEQEQVHLGIIAQELDKFEGSRFILNYDEEYGYSVNNYNLTSAVMSALRHHIKTTDEELDSIKQENLELKSKVDTLEQRLLRLEELIKKGDGEDGSLRNDVEN